MSLEQKEQEAIQQLVRHAEIHRVSINELKSLMAALSKGEGTPPGDNPDFCCHVGNLRIVYTIEEHPGMKCCGEWCRHLSVSKWPDGLPSVAEVNEVMKKFGFRGEVTDCDSMWMEDTGSVSAINLVQRYDA